MSEPLPWTEQTWIHVCWMLRPDLTEEEARVIWLKMQSEQTSEGPIKGYGEEVVRVPVRELRRLGELPPDVTIVRILHRAEEPNPRVPHEWMSTGTPLPGTVLYLHIQHRLCVRAPVRSYLMISELQEFLTRYKELTEAGR